MLRMMQQVCKQHLQAVLVRFIRGEFKIVSVWERPVEFNPNAVVSPEVKISGSFAYVNIFPEVIRLLARGVIDGQAVITSQIALEDIVEKASRH